MHLFDNATATSDTYTLSLHDALPIYIRRARSSYVGNRISSGGDAPGSTSTVRPRCSTPSESSAAWRTMRVYDPGCTNGRSEEHTSELQSQSNLLCRLLLEKKKRFWSS